MEKVKEWFADLKYVPYEIYDFIDGWIFNIYLDIACSRHCATVENVLSFIGKQKKLKSFFEKLLDKRPKV